MRYSTIAASLNIEKNAWSVAKSCIQIVRLIFHNHDRLEPSRGNNLQNMKTSAANSPAINFHQIKTLAQLLCIFCSKYHRYLSSFAE
jgi:hypothetical protein